MFDPTKGKLFLKHIAVCIKTLYHADLKFSLCSLPLTEIMSGDLLEDLMSSEGQFNRSKVLTECESIRFSCVWHLLLLPVSPPVFSPLLRLSPPPSDHDYIYNLDETEGLCDLFDVPILNLWPLRLSSGREEVSQTCLSTFIFSKISPHSLKVRGGAAELILSDEHSRTPLHWLSELSQTVAPRKASWRNAGKNRTFYLLLFFPRKHRQKQMTNNSIFGLWMRKRCFCISFPMYECVGTQVGCVCVCLSMCFEFCNECRFNSSQTSPGEKTKQWESIFLSGKESWQTNRAQLLSPHGSSPNTAG